MTKEITDQSSYGFRFKIRTFLNFKKEIIKKPRQYLLVPSEATIADRHCPPDAGG